MTDHQIDRFAEVIIGLWLLTISCLAVYLSFAVADTVFLYPTFPEVAARMTFSLFMGIAGIYGAGFALWG